MAALFANSDVFICESFDFKRIMHRLSVVYGEMLKL